MKRLNSREGYDLYARDYRKDHAHLDSFMAGAETEGAWADLARLAQADESLRADDAIRVGDLGCGDGRTLARWVRRAAKAGWADRLEFWGVDISPRMLEVARARIDGARFEVLDLGDAGALERWGSEVGGFDLVTAFFVLVHFDDPAAFFAAVRPLVVPGGRLWANSIPQPQAPELRVGGKPLVIEAWDHDADAVAAAAAAEGWVEVSRQDFRQGSEVVSTLFSWSRSTAVRD